MTWQLVRRDPAWELMPWLALVVTAMCVGWHFISAGALFPLVFLPVAFATPGAVVMQSEETRLFAVLPVTVRQVFWARMVSALAMIWLPVIAGMFALVAFRDTSGFELSLAHWVGFTFGVLAVQSAGIRGVALSRWWLMLLTVFPFLGDEARWLLARDSAIPWYAAIVCCVIGGAIVVRTWMIVPASFQGVIRMRKTVGVGMTKQASRNSPLQAWIPVWRTLFLWGGLLQMLLLFLTMLWYSGLAFSAIYLIGGWQAARKSMGWLVALPVPARPLLAAIVLPPVLALTAGYFVSLRIPTNQRGISVRAQQALPAWSPVSRETPNCKTLNVLPSLGYWVPVKSGRAPLIRSPWGETFQPSTFRVSGFDIYNPYAVGCDNSRHFLEWQFRRATIAVYGRPLALDTSNGWYNVEAQSVNTRARTQIVSAALPVLGWTVLLLVAMVFDWYRFRALAHGMRVTLITLVSAIAVQFAVWPLLGVAGIFNLDPAQWVSWTLPSSLSATVCILFGAVALCCWMLDRLFPQLELIDKPVGSQA